MSRVWGSREGVEASGGDDRGAKDAARGARNAYQKKEMELEDERERLRRLNAEVRVTKEALGRLKRAIEEAQIAAVRRESDKTELERSAADAERKVSEQKSRIARLEHEVENLREALHGRKTSGG